MKVAAHPMLVAVALGLLGPNALATETAEDEQARRDTADHADRDAQDAVARDRVMSALEDEDGPYWTRLALDTTEADSWSTDED